MTVPQYPKRLIEVDLPIKRISAHARYEKKSAGHGHLTTLHIWWARRPLAACRATICAALWPDPADPLCPVAFRQAAQDAMAAWAREHLVRVSSESYPRLIAIQKDPACLNDAEELRRVLCDFISDFSDWNNSTKREYLRVSHALTKAAHEALGGAHATLPLVLDPFAGGGSIPIEVARIGAEAYASDSNPVATLLNKVVMQYLPEAGEALPKLLAMWGKIIRDEIIEELGSLYPGDTVTDIPVAYIWARTVTCEGPACGTTIPLIRSLWLQKKRKNQVALELIPQPSERNVTFRVIHRPTAVQDGTVRRGSVTCPCCGYTTPVKNVRKQLFSSNGGTRDAQCVAIISSRPNVTGRYFRTPTDQDVSAVHVAAEQLAAMEHTYLRTEGKLPLDVELPLMSGVFNAPIYGITTWRSLYSSRQFLILLRFAEKIATLPDRPDLRNVSSTLIVPLVTCLGLVHSKLADLSNSLCNWEPNVPTVQHLFGRQAIQMSWDFAEGNILGESRGSWMLCLKSMVKVLEANSRLWTRGEVSCCDAAKHVLPNDFVSAVVTDPPYYNAVPYADLSDFFYTWLRRTVGRHHGDIFATPLVPKSDEICEMAGWDPKRYKNKDKLWFEERMTRALAESLRVLVPDGIAVIVFAHKSTTGWEAMLQAVIKAGWVFTASWPIDTELETRLRGMKSAALASSIHLVCRPRGSGSNGVEQEYVGQWRDVIQELPQRIRAWMPRLAEEGVVGADAIFACLGPALEIFSRYSRVEKTSGEVVTLKEYLEQVWAAVAKEALSLVFAGADTAGFEPDARLTAMWLWTLNAGGGGDAASADEADGDIGDDEETASKSKPKGGFTLEYDAARKIAQGLGAHLEELSHLVEIKGDQARLLPVAERTKHLFGKEEAQAPTRGRGKKKPVQGDLFADLIEAEEEAGWGVTGAPKAGETVLDRIHQGMTLFAAGRGEALKRFLVEEGAGRDQRFWSLAQALSALYPNDTDEKRWVDGVLARKKSFGF